MLAETVADTDGQTLGVLKYKVTLFSRFTSINSCSLHGTPRRFLRTRSTFSKSVMVSVAAVEMGMTELIFVDSRMKINGHYYCDVLLSQHSADAASDQACGR